MKFRKSCGLCDMLSIGTDRTGGMFAPARLLCRQRLSASVWFASIGSPAVRHAPIRFTSRWMPSDAAMMFVGQRSRDDIDLGCLSTRFDLTEGYFVAHSDWVVQLQNKLARLFYNSSANMTRYSHIAATVNANSAGFFIHHVFHRLVWMTLCRSYHELERQNVCVVDLRCESCQ